MNENTASNNIILSNGEVISRIKQNIDFVYKYKDIVEEKIELHEEKEIIYRELGSMVLSAIEAILKLACLEIFKRCKDHKCGKKECNYYKTRYDIQKMNINNLVSYFNNARFIFINQYEKSEIEQLNDLRNYIHISKYMEKKRQAVIFDQAFVEKLLSQYYEIYYQLCNTDWYINSESQCLKELDDNGYEMTEKMNENDLESFLNLKCYDLLCRLVDNEKMNESDEWFLLKAKEIKNIKWMAELLAYRILRLRCKYEGDEYKEKEEALFNGMIENYGMKKMVNQIKEEFKNKN